ncbi:hypothetical protein CHLRE_03g205500v5 [Chlamydomonas reinhardtii]|uniref:Uncharacterized protein n=1 Tax=Chlamydomonas reinhardtii TaxID=3055 RepID=A0A2K3DZ12_CHLRE|nr:uncharacterized protein CHLRE_03g205500v5 [Chlamydomonas reinhardtii]PNW85786.1 hypothetical protein CHLRE_03g205500v5 [Chlamydomonas reinhardtii]
MVSVVLLIVRSERSERSERKCADADDSYTIAQGNCLRGGVCNSGLTHPRLSLERACGGAGTLSPRRGSLQPRNGQSSRPASFDCRRRTSGVSSPLGAPDMPPGGSSDAWGCAQQGAGHHSDVGVLSTLQSQAQPAPRSSSKPCSVDLPRASNPNPGRHPQHHSSTAPVAARHAACAASSAASAAAPRTASGTALDGTSGGWDVDTIDNSLLLSIDLGLASGRMSAVEATELLASYGCDVQELLAAEMAAAAAEEEQDEAEQLRKGKGEEVERQEEERPSKEQEEQEALRMLLAA